MSLANQPVRAITKAAQLHNERINPKRGNYTKFSQKTRRAIVKRDGGLCVRCMRPYHSIHHIQFASNLGSGTEDNGVCVCLACHSWAHAGRKGREWFEWYKQTVLIPHYKVRDKP